MTVTRQEMRQTARHYVRHLRTYAAVLVAEQWKTEHPEFKKYENRTERRAIGLRRSRFLAVERKQARHDKENA